MTAKKDRWCIGCVHCDVNIGTSDYSELTAGEPASITCAKRVFEPMYQDDGRQVEHVMATAKTCKKYKERRT